MNLYKNSQKEIKKTGNITEGYLGYMSDTKKTGDTKVFSSLYVVSGSTIIPENLIKAAVTFFITRHTKNDWINHADLDLVPDIDHPDYKIFSENCIIYMLFSSQASIRRNVYSEGKKREIIKNNFFPFSVDQIKKLAIKYEYEEMLQDIEDYGENRHLYYVIHDLLKNNSLWEESIDVLNMYKDLIEITFPYRKKMDRKYEAYCFDQGWYVIKKILEKYYPDLLINFEKIFNNMEDRLFSEMKKLIDDNI